MKNKKAQLILGLSALAVVIAVSFGVASAKTQGDNSSNGLKIGQNKGEVKMKNNPVSDLPMGPGWAGNFSASQKSTDACTGKSKNDDCSFTDTNKNGIEKTVSGKCMISPKDKEVLACMPKLNNGEENGQKNSLEKIQKMKIKKEAEILRIESRVGKIIAFLQSKNVVTNEIEKYFGVFKEKAETFMVKIDSHLALLNDANSSEADIASSLSAVRLAGSDMKNYFNNTLKSSLQIALEGLID